MDSCWPLQASRLCVTWGGRPSPGARSPRGRTSRICSSLQPRPGSCPSAWSRTCLLPHGACVQRQTPGLHILACSIIMCRSHCYTHVGGDVSRCVWRVYLRLRATQWRTDFRQAVSLGWNIVRASCLREATAELVRRKNGTSHGSGRVHWGHVKAFHDGSLGSRTALMHQPYSDQHGNSGMRVTPLEQLRTMAAGADAAGLHVRANP